MEKTSNTGEVDLVPKFGFFLQSQQRLRGGKSLVWRRKEGFQLLPNDHAKTQTIM